MLNLIKMAEDYNSGKSIREIAKENDTYPNKVARLLKKSGVSMRSKEDAAKMAVSQGKIAPPMLGKKRTQEEKDNIGNKRAKKWQEMNIDQKDEFKKNAKDRWDAKSKEERTSMQKKAGEALRKASTEGSKTEKFLYEHLTKSGYDVTMHKVGLISGEKFEVDLYLPSMGVAIEIDGPQHFNPVFGQESLDRTIKYDAIKNGALLTKGLCVIRVKYLLRHTSRSSNIKLLQLIISELRKIENKFPEEGYRLIELEITNE